MKILGNLVEVSLSDVARMLAQARQTGNLVVRMTPERWISVVDGTIDMVDRADGVLLDRLAAWQRDPDPAEQFRIRRDRLMELILVDGSRAEFEFSTGHVEGSGLPPLDLAELAQRSLATVAPGAVARPRTPDGPVTVGTPIPAQVANQPPPRPSQHVPGVSERPPGQAPVVVRARREVVDPTGVPAVPSPSGPTETGRARQRALSRLISAVRSR